MEKGNTVNKKAEKMRKGKKPESIISNLEVDEIRVVKVEAQKLSDGTGKFKSEWEYKILKLEERTLSISAMCSVGFDPESLLSVKLWFLADYFCIEKLEMQQVHDAISHVLGPCCMKASIITGELTERMMGLPLIIPPSIQSIKEME